MSYGKSFFDLNKEGKSPEERLEMLESKIPCLLERIQIYDKIVNNEKFIKESVEAISKGLLDLQELHKAIEEKLDSYKKLCDGSIQSVSQSLNYKNLSLSEKINQIADQISNINKNLLLQNQEQNKKINEVASNSLLVSEFEKSDSILKSQLSALFKDSQDANIRIKELTMQAEALKASLADLGKTQKFTSSALFSLHTEVSNFQKTIQAVESNVKSTSQNAITSFSENFSKRLDEISVKLIPQGISLNEIKSEFMKNLLDFKLDVENSKLMATNNTKQMSLFEKKLENIYLLLKKNDLK